ncbi:restriction endonuclease subunit S [Opitutales bacterium]|nr:restriction endonuclease subunit S [Opitutales bacterium]
MKLEDLFEIRKGKKPKDVSLEDGENRIQSLQIDTLRNHDDKKFCEIDSSQIISKADDILIVWDGAYSGLSSFGLNGAIGSTIARLRPKGTLTFSPFVGCFLESKFKEIQGNCTGATIPHVNGKHLRNLQIPLPPLDEQKRIAGILDTADALRAKRRESLAKLDDLLQSTFLDMFGDPVTNPKGWETQKIGNLGVVTTGNTPSRKHKEFYGEDIEWIKSNNINTPSFFLTEAEEYLSLEGKKVGRTTPKGSILITCIAGSLSCIGNVAIANREVAFNQQINAFLPNENIELWFVFGMFWVDKRIIQNASTKAMKGMVSKSALSAISIPVPPLDLQQRFSEIVSSVEKQKAKMKKHLEQLDDLFASLQQRAFRGDL